jgi:hypothetical protein
MKNFIYALILSVFCFLLLPDMLSSRISKEAFIKTSVLSWPRQPIGVSGIVIELNKDYAYAHPRSNCDDLTHVWGEKQTKSCDGYNGDPWLWSGNDAHIFTVLEQDNIVSQALIWANAHKPTCSNGGYKSIFSITFFTDILTPLGSSIPYFVGCKVVYACCLAQPPKHFNKR